VLLPALSVYSFQEPHIPLCLLVDELAVGYYCNGMRVNQGRVKRLW